MPVAATRHDAAGAKAFAEFFIKTFDWGYATMSGAYLRHYSAPGCQGCKSQYDGIDADLEKGLVYVGGRTTILRVDPGGADPLTVQIVSVRTTGFEMEDAQGKFVYGEAPRSLLRFFVKLQWSAQGWQVAELSVIK